VGGSLQHSVSVADLVPRFYGGRCVGPVRLPIPMAPDHWRSDYVESLNLGAAVTISILRDQRLTYKEDYGGSTFTKFDGTRVTV
jgi:hypothetical protein